MLEIAAAMSSAQEKVTGSGKLDLSGVMAALAMANKQEGGEGRVWGQDQPVRGGNKAELPARWLEARRGQAGSDDHIEHVFRSVAASCEVLRGSCPVPQWVER